MRRKRKIPSGLFDVWCCKPNGRGIVLVGVGVARRTAKDMLEMYPKVDGCKTCATEHVGFAKWDGLGAKLFEQTHPDIDGCDYTGKDFRTSCRGDASTDDERERAGLPPRKLRKDEKPEVVNTGPVVNFLEGGLLWT